MRPALQRARYPLSFALQVNPDALTVTAQAFAGKRKLLPGPGDTPLTGKLSAAQKPELLPKLPANVLPNSEIPIFH